MFLADSSGSRYFHNLTEEYLAFLVSPGSYVLSVGCGTNDTFVGLLNSDSYELKPNSECKKFSHESCLNVEFIEGDIENPLVFNSLSERGPFDVILLKDTLGRLKDIQVFLSQLHCVCSPSTRIISVYYGYLWEPLLHLWDKLKLTKREKSTWLRMTDVENFMCISGFEIVKKEWRILCPFKLLGIGDFINRYVATLPLVRKLCLRHYLVARPIPDVQSEFETVSVIIPCRNEKGNIENAISRLPELGSHTEVIFVEGHSTDGTWEEIQRVKQKFPSIDIKSLLQPGIGKGDAIRAAFDQAIGDILIILDADLTVPPEELPKFLVAITSGRGEYINGSRLIYGMEDQAMRFLNYVANHVFAYLFTYLINQKLTDTLCGTKVLRRKDYQRIAANRRYFGEFDPFGDFDLIFGASKLNLKFIELPVRYTSRQYGETQISRFRHGLLLLRMVIFAYRKLKAF